jgi:hypothetical protein
MEIAIAAVVVIFFPAVFARSMDFLSLCHSFHVRSTWPCHALDMAQ